MIYNNDYLQFGILKIDCFSRALIPLKFCCLYDILKFDLLRYLKIYFIKRNSKFCLNKKKQNIFDLYCLYARRA